MSVARQTAGGPPSTDRWSIKSARPLRQPRSSLSYDAIPQQAQGRLFCLWSPARNTLAGVVALQELSEGSCSLEVIAAALDPVAESYELLFWLVSLPLLEHHLLGCAGPVYVFLDPLSKYQLAFSRCGFVNCVPDELVPGEIEGTGRVVMRYDDKLLPMMLSSVYLQGTGSMGRTVPHLFFGPPFNCVRFLEMLRDCLDHPISPYRQ